MWSPGKNLEVGSCSEVESPVEHEFQCNMPLPDDYRARGYLPGYERTPSIGINRAVPPTRPRSNQKNF
jgi:hypothetical protein